MVLVKSAGLESRGSGSPWAFKQVTFPSRATISLVLNDNQYSAFLSVLMWGSMLAVSRGMVH